jgi:hypothetical protein
MSNRVPDFQTYGDIQRGVAIWPGHECLVKDGKDYGIADDDWVVAVRDAQCVAVLRVSSRALNGRLLTTPERVRQWDEDYERQYNYRAPPPRGIRIGVLGFCSSFPVDVSSIRDASNPEDCSFQVSGSHYTGETTCLGADPLMLGLDETFMSGPPAWWLASPDVVKRELMERGDVWTPLEAWFRERRQAALKSNAALPRRCTHCDGTGVIPPRRDR